MNENAATPSHHPLIERLIRDIGCVEIGAGNIDAFTTDVTDTVLFFSGDPVRNAESLDVAVILPELARQFAGRFRVGVVRRDVETALQARYGFARWPALVFLRAGEYVGAIQGVRDWGEYLQAVNDLLASSPTRPPTVGIPVRNAAGCH